MEAPGQAVGGDGGEGGGFAGGWRAGAFGGGFGGGGAGWGGGAFWEGREVTFWGGGVGGGLISGRRGSRILERGWAEWSHLPGKRCSSCCLRSATLGCTDMGSSSRGGKGAVQSGWRGCGAPADTEPFGGCDRSPL